MSLLQDHLECIVSAVLAVNLYGLERSYALLPAMRSAGLLNPQFVANEDLAKVITMLAEVGYNRGRLMEMMTIRFVSVMKAAQKGDLDSLDDLITSRDKAGAIELLCQINGIGPKVASDAWMLICGEDSRPTRT